MEERESKARDRFEAMLNNARAAVYDASRDRHASRLPPTTLLAAIKSMQRAGGYLEAISIVMPQLGRELIDEFEGFAAQVDELASGRTEILERRSPAAARRTSSDRRGWDRRLGRDRRRDHIEVLVDRRGIAERRLAQDRRNAELRKMADRRIRSLVR